MAKRRKKDDGTRGALIFLMVLLIIAVVGVMGYTGKVYVDQKGNDNSASNAQSNNVATTQQPKDDKKDDQTKTEPVDDTKKDEPEAKPEENTQPKEEVNVSDEDKAIDLAKKQYGTTDGVYYRVEQIKSNSVYIVSVRDNETTRDLAWYTVDVAAGTVK